MGGCHSNTIVPLHKNITPVSSYNICSNLTNKISTNSINDILQWPCEFTVFNNELIAYYKKALIVIPFKKNVLNTFNSVTIRYIKKITGSELFLVEKYLKLSSFLVFT